AGDRPGVSAFVHRGSARPAGESEGSGVLVGSVRVASADGRAHRSAQGNGVSGKPVAGDPMAIARQATGLAIIRVCIGTFFLAEGVSKYRWFSDSSMLAGQLSGWAQNAAPGSFSARYLEHVALPWAVY